MSIRSNLNARRLDTRIQLERRVLDANGDIIGWTPLGGRCWAAVDGAKANERFIADGTRSVYAYTVWIRADIFQSRGVGVEDRVVCVADQDRPLDIKAADQQGLRGRFIPLSCEAGVNKG